MKILWQKKRSEYEALLKKWYYSEMVMPDSIFVVKNGSAVLMEDNPLNKNNFKILTFISGDCEKCLSDADKWCVLFDTLSKLAPLDFLPVFFTSDYKQFITYYHNRLPDCFEPLLDIHFRFIHNNSIPGDWDLRTFLLDRKNRILIIGNPIYNSDIRNLMINKILENE